LYIKFLVNVRIFSYINLINMSFVSIANEDTLLSIMIRFGINFIVLFILVRLIYYRYTKKEEFLFSFFLMGIIIFFICAILETVDIQLGMALGLFAIFAILRFRTVTYTVKDMTYIFTIIGISVINSQANVPPPLIGAIVLNSIILITVFVLEIFLKKRALNSLIIIYYKIDLLNPVYRKELLKDLSEQTGENIEKVKIRKIDINKSSSEIEVYFKDKSNN
jgi:hypothetical protein